MAVGRCADRVDDGVVVRGQLGRAERRADLDVAEEAKALQRRGLVEHPRDGLDVRVVGRDARAHEPERRRQHVEEVDLRAGLEEMGRGVEARGTRPDDRHLHVVSPALSLCAGGGTVARSGRVTAPSSGR